MNPPLKFELSIIGLGYVGLPLGLQFAKSGCRVLGLCGQVRILKFLYKRNEIRRLSELQGILIKDL